MAPSLGRMTGEAGEAEVDSAECMVAGEAREEAGLAPLAMADSPELPQPNFRMEPFSVGFSSMGTVMSRVPLSVRDLTVFTSTCVATRRAMETFVVVCMDSRNMIRQSTEPRYWICYVLV